MTTTALQPLAQEKNTGEIVQLWRNAEFKELKKFCAGLQKSGSQPHITGLAELLSKIISTTGASDIYNDLNAFEKAVYLFENAKSKKGSDELLVPAEARNFDLFVKYHRIVSEYYSDGEPQLRDDRLVNELVDVVQKYKIHTTHDQQEEYTDKVGKLNRDIGVIRKGYGDIAATVQRLVDEENKRTDGDNKKISTENSIMNSSFRAKIYQTVFKGESAATAFEIALYTFKYQIHEFIMPLNKAESYLSDKILLHKLNIVKQRMVNNK